MRTVQIIGPGRVGRSLATSLRGAGWDVAPLLGRGDDPRAAAQHADLVVLATPDGAVAAVAAGIEPSPSAVVAHCSGALGLDVLAPHLRRGALHPLASLPDADVGAERLAGGCAFAVDGDRLVEAVVADLGGRAFRVPASARAHYHAAATIAANHLVALMGQVERVSAPSGVPLDAYLDLAAQTLENVRRLGPATALTGPVARGDWDTVDRHLQAIDPDEQPAYRAMADLAARLTSAGARA